MFIEMDLPSAITGLLIATSGNSHADDEARGEQTKVHEGILQALSV